MSDRAGGGAVDWPTAKLASTRQPSRTCLGCREHDDKANLVRLVAVTDHVAVDETSRLPGRGAYLHPRQACLESALRRRSLNRALRSQSPLGTDGLREYFAGLPTTVKSSGAVE